MVMILMFISMFITTVFAADIWKYRIQEVQVKGNDIYIVVYLYVNGMFYCGREITFPIIELSSLTNQEILEKINVIVKVISDSEKGSYLLQDKIRTAVNGEISIP